MKTLLFLSILTGLFAIGCSQQTAAPEVKVPVVEKPLVGVGETIPASEFFQ